MQRSDGVKYVLLRAPTVTVEQRLAFVIDVYAETWILVAIAFAVTWYWTAGYPLPICFFRVAELLGYLFCLHIASTSFMRCPIHTITGTAMLLPKALYLGPSGVSLPLALMSV